MALSNKEKKLFVIGTLLQSEYGVDQLREFLKKDDYPNHFIISGTSNGELDVVNPTYAQQHFSLRDTAFEYFVEQKILDGYLYGSAESFRKLVGLE